MTKVDWRRFVNEKLSGRKVNRWLTTMIMAAIGIAVAIAFFRWAGGEEMAKLPGETIIIASLPYLNAAWDNFVCSNETQTGMNFGAGHPNPHGGPGAP